VDPQAGKEVRTYIDKPRPPIIKKIDNGWDELDDRIRLAEPSVLDEIGITYSSFASMLKGKRAKPAAEWVDYLRCYLLAWRAGGESRGFPAKPAAKAPEKDDEKEAYRLQVIKWNAAVDKLKGDLRPTDKAAFHRWCEEIMAEKGESAQKDFATLWVLLSAYAEDERNERRSDFLRQTMQPRVSGNLSLMWKKHPGGASVTAVELMQGLGRSVDGNDRGNTEGLAAEAVKPVSHEGTQAAGEAAVDAGSAAAGVKASDPTAAPTGEPPKGEELQK
jgi:hypothetical protein